MPPQHVLIDRPDDVIGPQVKVMYVLPSDGSDRLLDQDRTLSTSVEAWTRWVQKATSGQRRASVDGAGRSL